MNDVLNNGLPDMEGERSRVEDAVLRSGIGVVSRDDWMRPCPMCKSMDTAVYRWREKGIFSKRFAPGSDNLPLKYSPDAI